MSMSDIPLEIIAIILSLLPVNHLLVLRVVCKTWRDLIDSPMLVNLHLSQSQNRHIIIRHKHLHSLSLNSVENGPEVTTTIIKHDPIWYNDYGTEVWGSCNGLLCISNKLDTVAIWNFSTRKTHILPYAPLEFKDLEKNRHTRIYGFGYDKTSDDYKVVRIVVRETFGFVPDNEIKVYSLKSDTWHMVQKFAKGPTLNRTGGVLVGGCLHWITMEWSLLHQGTEIEIITFDLEREVSDYVEQPDYTDGSLYKNVSSLHGCLSISCNYRTLNNVDIWVMKDYGVKESWCKLLSIVEPAGLRAPIEYMHPIAYSKSGKELLLKLSGELIWYDIEKVKMRFVKVKGVRNLIQLDVCGKALSLYRRGKSLTFRNLFWVS